MQLWQRVHGASQLDTLRKMPYEESKTKMKAEALRAVESKR
jgi:hypothetical protein